MKNTINRYIKIGCYTKIAKYLMEYFNEKYDHISSYNEFCDIIFYYELYIKSKEYKYNQIMIDIINKCTTLEKQPDKLVEIIKEIGHTKLNLSLQFVGNFLDLSVDTDLKYNLIENTLHKSRYIYFKYLVKPTIYCIENGNIKLLSIIIDRIKDDYQNYIVFDKCADFCVQYNFIDALKILPIEHNMSNLVTKCIQLDKIQCLDIITSNTKYKEINKEKIIINCIDSGKLNFVQYLSRQSTYEIDNLVKYCIKKISNISDLKSAITYIIKNNINRYYYHSPTLERLIECLVSNHLICCLIILLKHPSFRFDSMTQNIIFILNNLVFENSRDIYYIVV